MSTCTYCGADAAVTVGQHVVRERLVWHRSVACAVCGARTEADDVGFPPDDVRAAILARDGEHSVHVTGEHDRLRAWGVVRDALQLTLEQLLARRSRSADDPTLVYRGTLAEATWIRARLATAGISAVVRGTLT